MQFMTHVWLETAIITANTFFYHIYTFANVSQSYKSLCRSLTYWFLLILSCFISWRFYKNVIVFLIQPTIFLGRCLHHGEIEKSISFLRLHVLAFTFFCVFVFLVCQFRVFAFSISSFCYPDFSISRLESEMRKRENAK